MGQSVFGRGEISRWQEFQEGVELVWTFVLLIGGTVFCGAMVWGLVLIVWGLF